MAFLFGLVRLIAIRTKRTLRSAIWAHISLARAEWAVFAIALEKTMDC
jgi:hypothetical protein